MPATIAACLTAVAAATAQTDPIVTGYPDDERLVVFGGAAFSFPLHPGVFRTDWRRGSAFNIRAAYAVTPELRLSLDASYAGFDTDRGPLNPELFLVTVIGGVTLSRAMVFGTGYGRAGAGLSRRGVRRVIIDGGTFTYSGVPLTKTWTNGVAVEGMVGTTFHTGVVFPFLEVGYHVSTVLSGPIGHVTLRTGVGMNVSRFLEGLRDRPERRRRPPPRERNRPRPG